MHVTHAYCSLSAGRTLSFGRESVDMQTFELIGFLDKHAYSGFFIRLSPLCFGALAALCVMDSSCGQKVAKGQQFSLKCQEQCEHSI